MIVHAPHISVGAVSRAKPGREVPEILPGQRPVIRGGGPLESGVSTTHVAQDRPLGGPGVISGCRTSPRRSMAVRPTEASDDRGSGGGEAVRITTASTTGRSVSVRRGVPRIRGAGRR